MRLIFQMKKKNSPNKTTQNKDETEILTFDTVLDISHLLSRENLFTDMNEQQSSTNDPIQEFGLVYINENGDELENINIITTSTVENYALYD